MTKSARLFQRISRNREKRGKVRLFSDPPHSQCLELLRMTPNIANQQRFVRAADVEGLKSLRLQLRGDSGHCAAAEVAETSDSPTVAAC